MEKVSRLPKILIPTSLKRDGRYPLGAYLCIIDPEQKEKHYFTKEDGTQGLLYIDRRFTNNHLDRHQNVAKIVDCVGDTEFSVGTELVCYHYSFSDHTDELHPIYIDDNKEMYFRVANDNVYFGIVNNELVPRHGNLLCEPIKEKIYETTLELADSLIEERRDVVRVVKTWDGCTEYKEGDFLMIVKHADYPFEFKGNKYLKVDTLRDDVLAILPDAKVRKTEVLRHMTDEQRERETSFN